MKRIILTALAILFVEASASVHSELGDAPPMLPGEPTFSAGPLDAIYGRLDPGGDVDVYAISIPVPGPFSATTVDHSGVDTQLYLFGGPGMGITMNDDAVVGPPQSLVTGAFIFAPGTYYLAVTSWPIEPVNPGAAPIWLAFLGFERPPDGPGAPGPLAGWAGPPFLDGDYFIVFTGTMPTGPPIPPPPVWSEQGDAPDLPAGQTNYGPGNLERIVGTLSGPGDVDLYRVRINKPGGFGARVATGSPVDPQLFLFTRNGMAVTHNDDDPAGSTRSVLSSINIPAPGVYLLAVSAFNVDPFNPGGDLIWNDVPFNVERTPDGPGAPGPLFAWGGLGAGPGGNYAINLNGAVFDDGPSTNVQPTSLALGPGIVISGGLPEVLTADNNRYVVRPGPVLIATQAPIRITLEGTSPDPTPNQLRLNFEGQAGLPTIVMKTFAFNFNTSVFDEIDSRTLSLNTDAAFSVDVGNPNPYVDPAGLMRMRFECKPAGAVLVYPWQVRMDLVGWTIVQ